MLISDLREMGERMYAARKRLGLTQAEAAEHTGLSDRGYADVERGKVNVRLATLLRICRTLRVTPDELLMSRPEQTAPEEGPLLDRLHACSARDRDTAMRLLSVYLTSLEK